MTVTAQLRKVFETDKLIRGLTGRLDGAERFLAEQLKQQRDVDGKHTAAQTALRQLKAQHANLEAEAGAHQQRMDKLREQMNAAKNNKEYSAFLTELNTLKTAKDEVEKKQLELMEQIEKSEEAFKAIEAARAERSVIVEKAKADRASREAEIKDRLAELKTQRAEQAKAAPADALKILEDLLAKRGEDAMAKVEEINRRAHEWSCGACMMALTVQTINAIAAGRLTRCSNCQCILYSEDEDIASKKTPKKAGKADL